MTRSAAITRATIVGAGPAGLAAALALAQRGIAATVIDRGDRPSGGGLQIPPNGVKILDRLGVGIAVRNAAISARILNIRDFGSWHPLHRMRLDQYPEDYLLVRRSSLVTALLEACRARGLQIEHGRTLVELSEDGGTVRWTDGIGRQMETDLLIGADGVDSTVRSHIGGSLASSVTHKAWRCLLPCCPQFEPGEVDIAIAPGRHMVAYSLQDQSVNVVLVAKATSYTVQKGQSPARIFADFGGPVAQMLKQHQPETHWRLRGSAISTRWSSAASVLVGDALHPMLPFLAQGASMAFEDADILADALAEFSDLSHALAAYRERREARLQRLLRALALQARINHAAFPPLRIAINTGLRLSSRFMPRLIASRYDWLFGAPLSS